MVLGFSKILNLPYLVVATRVLKSCSAPHVVRTKLLFFGSILKGILIALPVVHSKSIHTINQSTKMGEPISTDTRWLLQSISLLPWKANQFGRMWKIKNKTFKHLKNAWRAEGSELLSKSVEQSIKESRLQ